MEIVFDFILQSSQITFGEESQPIYVDNKPTDVQVSFFLNNLQQPIKKIDQEAYSRILLVLRIELDLVSTTYAQQKLENYESEQEFAHRNKVRKRDAVLQNEPQLKKRKKGNDKT